MVARHLDASAESRRAHVAQLAEHFLGKDEVSGSSPDVGSIPGQVDGGRDAQRVNPNVVLPFLSSLLSFIFAILVGDQWLRRRQPYQLVWAIGLLWYGISAGTEFLGERLRLERAAVSGLVPDRRLRRRRLPRPRHRLPAGNTRFGYFVAFSVFAGGLFSILAAAARAKEGDPASAGTVARGRGLLHGGGDRAGGGHARSAPGGGAAGDRHPGGGDPPWSLVLTLHPAGRPAGLRAGSGDRRADRRRLPAGPAHPDAAVQHRRRRSPWSSARSTPPTSSCPRTGSCGSRAVRR